MKTVKRKDAKGFEAIFADEATSELEKILAAFDYVTRLEILQSEKDIELNRALGDQQAVIRDQIKKSTLIHTRSILNVCHQRVTGKEVYDEYTQ
jgi:hypothetical protein